MRMKKLLIYLNIFNKKYKKGKKYFKNIMAIMNSI